MVDKAQFVIPVPLGMVNAFIVQGELAVIIDTGFPGSDRKILRVMEQAEIKPVDVSLILITHGHDDHFGSVAALKKETGAPVAIGKGDAEALQTAVNPPLYPVGAAGKIMSAMIKYMKKPKMQGLEADILIEKETDLSQHGVSGKIILTPGHSDGCLSVMLSGGEAIIGDLVFGGMLCKTAPGFPYFCKDKAQLLTSIKAVLDLQPTIIYAGHGGPFTPEAVRRRFFG